MSTIQNQKIGLRIAGTKTRQGGFAPLVAVGILAGNEGDNMDKITLIAEKPVYVIKHTKDYILYQLKDRKVKPCDRDTTGILSIALTITRDVQLADGKSPYSLLKEVYDKFVTCYMERSSDGLDSFVNKDIDQSDFISILEQYPLESRMSKYIPMDPNGMSGILCVSQDKMADLFRDSQYQEFAQFKEIEIGINCATMPGLENIEIPRPQIYSVSVNGNNIATTLKDRTDFFDTATILHDTQDLTYENISFNLVDLLDSPTHCIHKGKTSVTLDIAHDCIACNVHQERITYKLSYSVKGESENFKKEVIGKITTGQIKILFGGNPAKFTMSSPMETTIPASYTNQKVDIAPNFEHNAYNLNVKTDVDHAERSINITITINPIKTIGDVIRYSNDNTSRKVTKELSSSRSNKYDADIINHTSHADNEKKHDSIIQKTGLRSKLFFLLIGIIIGMCIGFGTWGVFNTIKKKEPFSVDSLQIYNIWKSREKFEQEIKKEDTGDIQEDTTKEEGTIQQEDTQEQEETERIVDATIAQSQVQTKNQIRQEILELVKKKDLDGCRTNNKWKSLTKTEQYAVESVLNLKQYKGAPKKRIEDLLKNKSFDNWNWDSLMNTRQEILNIISNK